jgi:hypothetical protein
MDGRTDEEFDALKRAAAPATDTFSCLVSSDTVLQGCDE